MKDITLLRIGDTTNGLYRHSEVHDDGSIHTYQHNYKDGEAESSLLILYPEDMEMLMPAIVEQRKKMGLAT